MKLSEINSENAPVYSVLRKRAENDYYWGDDGSPYLTVVDGKAVWSDGTDCKIELDGVGVGANSDVMMKGSGYIGWDRLRLH